MDNYTWRTDQDYPLVKHLKPNNPATNFGQCRACIIQTGRDRYVVNEDNRARNVLATYTDFPSPEAAHRFIERFSDLCGEFMSRQLAEDVPSSSLSVSS